MTFTCSKILPHVYHLHFKDHYQLAMHFLRMQEFYESPVFADRIFTLVEFMEWYADKHGNGVFSYPKDWSGFNVPSWVAERVYTYSTEIPDFNHYDRRMYDLITELTYKEGKVLPGGRTAFECRYSAPKQNWYLIGTSDRGCKEGGNARDVLDHEIAHALYYTNSEYKESVDSLLRGSIGDPSAITDTNPSWVIEAGAVLLDMGYHERVLADEIQAYASTGTCAVLDEILTAELCAPFAENYKNFKDRCQSPV